MLRKYAYASRNFGKVQRADSITCVTKLARNSVVTHSWNLGIRFLEDSKPKLYNNNLMQKNCVDPEVKGI